MFATIMPDSMAVWVAICVVVGLVCVVFWGVTGGAKSLFAKTFSAWPGAISRTGHRVAGAGAGGGAAMNDTLKGKTVGIEMWGYLSTRTRLLFKTMAAKTLANHLPNTNQPHCDYARFELIVDNTVAYVRDVRTAIDGNVVMYLEGIPDPGKVGAT